MIHAALVHLRAQWMGALALFLVIAGGTAYAVDTVGSADIIDESILSQDIKNAEVKTTELAASAVQTGKIADNQVFSADVRDDTLPNGGLTAADLAANAVGTSEVDGSLTGDDIDETTLFNDDSLTGDDISNASTLGGAEINESALGTVPAAANAQKVGNNTVVQLSIAADNGGGVSSVGGIGGGGLSLLLRCGLFDQPPGDLDVTVSTNTNNSTLAVSDDDSYEDIEDWDVADNPVDLEKLVGADSDEVINLVYRRGNGFGLGHPVTTGQLHILDDAPAGDTSECVLAGHLIVGPS